MRLRALDLADEGRFDSRGECDAGYV